MSGRQLIKNIKISKAFIVIQKMRILEINGKNQRKQEVVNVVEQLLKSLRKKLDEEHQTMKKPQRMN